MTRALEVLLGAVSIAFAAGVALGQATELTDSQMRSTTGGMPPPNNCCYVDPCCEWECTYYDEDKCVYKIPIGGQHCWTPPPQWGDQDGCVGTPLGDPPAEAAKCCLIVTVDPDGPCDETEAGGKLCPGTIIGEECSAQYYGTYCETSNCKALVMHGSPSSPLERYAGLVVLRDRVGG